MQRRCIKVELLRREQYKHRSTEHKPHLSFFWLFTFLRRAHISDSRALLTFSGANVQRCSVQFLKSATSKNVKLPFSHICCLLSATKLQSSQVCNVSDTFVTISHFPPFISPLWLSEVPQIGALHQSQQSRRHRCRRPRLSPPSRWSRIRLYVWTGTTSARWWRRSLTTALHLRFLWRQREISSQSPQLCI